MFQSSSQASLVQDVTLSKMLAENEQKVDQLTEAWVDKWREAARIMQVKPIVKTQTFKGTLQNW